MEETTRGKEERNREKDHTHSNISEGTPDNGRDVVISVCPSCFSFGWKYIIEGGKHVLFAPQPVQYENGDRNEPFARQKNNPTVEEASSSSKIDCRLCRVKAYHSNCDNGAGNVLLRVRKEDLKNAKWFRTRGAADTVDHHIDQLSSFSKSSLYNRHIVAPYLEKYIDVAEPVQLSRNFLASLYDNAMASGKIPPSRLKDWTSFELPKEEGALLRSTVIGAFVKDYRSRLTVSLNQHRDPKDNPFLPLAIEFKPKAGYLALTPFVLPQRRHLKFKQSRFVSLQQLQQQGLWTKGWAANVASLKKDKNGENSNNSTSISLYDPVVFFHHVVDNLKKRNTNILARPQLRRYRQQNQHGNDHYTSTPSVSCLRETISHLLDNPQNNLRCFVGDSDILSENGEEKHEKRQLLLDAIFGACTYSSADTNDNLIERNHDDKLRHQQPQNILKNLLQDILEQVFTSHDGVDLLSRIHKWQSDLDILDVDGALMVYDRLIELLKQQPQDDEEDVHIRAQYLIDCITESDLEKRIEGQREFGDNSDRPSILSASPFHFDSCQEKGPTWIDDLFNEVESFQKLLAATHPQLPAEDVMDSAHQKCLDIVGSLNIEECRFLLQNWLLSLMMCDISIFISLQRTAVPSIADLSSNNNKNLLKVSDGLSYLSFQLRVIDTDQKPSSKIPGKREKEQAFG